MQLLYEGSDEGDVACLGVVPGRVVRMTPMPGARIPHMGWNTLRATGDAAPLLEGIDDGATAYFVHGSAAPVSFDSVALASPGETFCAGVRSRLSCGVKFHPTRSGGAGAP